ncbi:ATG8/AUT7/APG8/PAZ2 (plasmid) [Leishmania braziliensis MHOM/BR/75/M2904]|uniref:Autophagy-related protein n=1 Tax=Leishmania braziliensis MHOM/BR/75/M2904 TaxID=420245 RepID=A0A3P3Z3V0_LEIBR|nr:ATG8/AUT7/APG8/PAZ2 [Leishmania braziliensis MHOM/BR/75/M2904]
MSAYQSSNTAEARRAECARLQAKYPGHVAMVVEAAKSSKAHLLALPRDATVAELEAAVRQALGISAAKVTLAVEGCTPAATAAVGDVADACKHADGFLYVSVRGDGQRLTNQHPPGEQPHSRLTTARRTPAACARLQQERGNAHRPALHVYIRISNRTMR